MWARRACADSSGGASHVNNSSKQGADPLTPARPLGVAVLSVIGFLVSLMLVPLPSAWHHGFGYAFRMLLSSVLGMVCMYGFWRMWRWSVFIYGGLAVFDAAHYLMLSHRGYGGPALESLIALLCFMYVRKMR